MIAALYVATDGPYFGVPGVDPWDEDRDARAYAGPHPVIAHPPCQRWGKLYAGSPSYIARTGIRKKLGDDDGCFKAALAAVRKFGGVLEHPYQSRAWPHFGIARPPRSGGWIPTGDGGFTCTVEQGRYGHYARKPTYLLTYRIPRERLPELDWGHSPPDYPDWAVKKYGMERLKRIGELSLKGGGVDAKARIHTPIAFRNVLIDLAGRVG